MKQTVAFLFLNFRIVLFQVRKSFSSNVDDFVYRTSKERERVREREGKIEARFDEHSGKITQSNLKGEDGKVKRRSQTRSSGNNNDKHKKCNLLTFKKVTYFF